MLRRIWATHATASHVPLPHLHVQDGLRGIVEEDEGKQSAPPHGMPDTPAERFLLEQQWHESRETKGLLQSLRETELFDLQWLLPRRPSPPFHNFSLSLHLDSLPPPTSSPFPVGGPTPSPSLSPLPSPPLPPSHKTTMMYGNHDVRQPLHAISFAHHMGPIWLPVFGRPPAHLFMEPSVGHDEHQLLQLCGRGC